MWMNLLYAASAVFGLASKNHTNRHVGVHALKHLLQSIFGGGRHR